MVVYDIFLEVLYNSYAEKPIETFVAGLPGVLWVLPDSYIDVKNKDYGGWVSFLTLYLFSPLFLEYGIVIC